MCKCRAAGNFEYKCDTLLSQHFVRARALVILLDYRNKTTGGTSAGEGFYPQISVHHGAYAAECQL